MDQAKHTRPVNDRQHAGRRVVLVAAAVAFALLGDQALYALAALPGLVAVPSATDSSGVDGA